MAEANTGAFLPEVVCNGPRTADWIEAIVGVKRHRQAHCGRAVSAEQAVYILHSQRCLDSRVDLRKCRFSVALDRGIDIRDWDGMEDRAVVLCVWRGTLRPIPGGAGTVSDHPPADNAPSVPD